MNTYFIITLIILGFTIGFLFGMTLGTQLVIQKIAYMGANVFAGSNININLKFNETTLVNEFNKTIIPIIKDIKEEKKK